MSAARAGDVLGGRYLLTEPLGRGATATVWRAVDRAGEREVAVKIVAGDDAIAAARRELWAAHEGGHPGLARALDVGRVGDSAFVVLELAPGDAFDVALRDADVLSIAAAADALLDALSALHARSLVHGDLKPENVRVAWSAGRPELRLLDLGMVRPVGTAGGGNATYGAPELHGGRVSCASDVFSVGVMLYEVLEKRLPFGNAGDPAYLTRLVCGESAPMEREVPTSLREVIARAIGREPAARYATATDARAALRAAMPDLLPARGVPVAPPLIARVEAVSQAQAVVARLVRGESPRAVVVGPPGTGRTTLLRRAGAEARLLGCATLEVSAADGAHAMLVSLARGVLALGIGELGEHAKQALSIGRVQHEERFALWTAVLAALEAAAARQPLLVCVDDADRADAGVTEALHFLSGAAPSHPIAFLRVGSEEADETAVRLRPLDVADTAELVAAMLPGIDEPMELAMIAHRRTAGLPRDVVRGVRALVASNGVGFVGTVWRKWAEGLPDDAFEPAIDPEAAARVRALGAPSREAIAAAAVARIPIEPAAEALGLSVDAEQLLHTGLCRRSGNETVIASAHLAEQIRTLIGDAEVVRLRIRLVDALRENENTRVRAVRPVLLAELGDEDQAVADGLAAAERAGREGDFHLAASLYERCRAWGGAAVARRIGAREAEVLSALGRFDDALIVVERACEAGARASTVAAVRGCVLARLGRYAEAIDVLWGAEQTPDATFWLGWSLMMRGRYEDAERIASVTTHDPRERARLSRLRGTIAWHRGRADAAVPILRGAVADAQRAGDPLLQVEAMQSLGTAERMRGDLDAAARFFGAAVSLARSRGYAPVLAKCLNNLAIAEYQGGRWDGARHAWESMQELARRIRSDEEVLLSHNNLALLHRDRGELERAERELTAALALARRSGILRHEAMVLGNRAEVRTIAGELSGAESDLDAAEKAAGAMKLDDELVECARRRAAIAQVRGDHAAAYAQAVAAAAQAEAISAHVEQGLALLLAAGSARQLGRLTEARLKLTAARAALGRSGTRLEQARADLEEARIRAASNDPVGARRSARSAAEAFTALGARRELFAARELENGEEREGRTEALVEMLCFAAKVEDADVLLDGILTRIVEATSAERGFVIMLDGDQGPYVAARKDEGGAGELPRLSRGVADQVVASGRPLVLADVGDSVDLATRESVVELGLRAAVCAPLMRGERCLGLLYVDSTDGQSLMRIGPMLLDAACTLVVPALERIGEREREAERVALLESAAHHAIRTASSLAAAIELLADEPDPARRAELARTAGERVQSETDRAEEILRLLRLDRDNATATEPVPVAAILGFAMDALREAPFSIEVRNVPPGLHVDGDLERLATVVLRMVERVGRDAGPGANVVLEADRAEGQRGPGLVGWRPGESAGLTYVRIEARASKERPVESKPEVSARETDALPLRGARRIVRKASGVMRMDIEGDEVRLAVELPARSGDQEAA